MLVGKNTKTLDYLINQIPNSCYASILDLLKDVSAKIEAVGLMSSTRESYGLIVAYSQYRNLLIALMTAAAVVDLKEKGQKDITVIELGLGIGINAFVALITGATKAIGYETSQKCLGFAKKMAGEYGFSDLIEFHNTDFLKVDYFGLQADVIVNENLSPGLVQEPQIAASQAVLPATHPKTRFVPQAVDIAVSGIDLEDGELYEIGAIDFSKKYDFPIRFNLEGDVKVDRSFLRMQYFFQIRDFRRKIVVAYEDGIDELPLISDNWRYIDVPGRYRLVFEFDDIFYQHKRPDFRAERIECP